MRIMWFVNIPFSKVSQHLKSQEAVLGGWMETMLQELRNTTNMDFAVVWAGSKVKNVVKIEQGNVSYYIFPAKYAYKRSKEKKYKKELNYCMEIINEFSPDLIDIYGTENFYGLIGGLTNIPVIINYF